MALGPSIFLPCNHSGALVLFIFQERAFNNQNNKIYAYKKLNYFYMFDFLIAIVFKVAKYDQCSTNALEQSLSIRNELPVDKSFDQWRRWREAFTLILFFLR